MTWSLQLTDPAQKEFQNLPPKDQARVRAVLVAMEKDPFQGDIKRLQGQSTGCAGVLGATGLFTTYISNSV